MKTTLIRLPNFHLYDEKQQPPLGILYLAAYLEKHGKQVDVCDLAAVPAWGWETLLPESDLYGITATSPDYPMAVKMLTLLRRIRPEAQVIIGGIHATILPEQCVTDGFDAAVIGEGEETLLEWVSGKQKGQIDGICFKYCGELARTKHRHLRKNIDEFPFPARHALPVDHILSEDLVTDNAKATVITTSRGCPFRCSFCANGKGATWNGTWRMRSSENIAAELMHIKANYDVDEIRFVDDMIGARPEHIRGICAAMSQAELKWRCHLRVDKARADDLQLMADSGCLEISLGIESADETVLKHNRKGWSKPAMAVLAASTAKAAGLRVRAYFIVGLPGETPASIVKMKEMIAVIPADAVNIFSFIPYPGCDVYQNPQRYDYTLHDKDNFENYWMLGDGHRFIGSTSAMAVCDLEQAYQDCWQIARETGKAKWIAKQKESGDGGREEGNRGTTGSTCDSASQECAATGG